MNPELPKQPPRAVSEALPNRVSLENTQLPNQSDALLDFDSPITHNTSSQSVIISDYEPFQNRFGAVRLQPVRDHFGLLPLSSDIPMIKELYVKWSTFDEIMPIRCIYRVHDENGGSHMVQELSIHKSIKRGNDVYIKAVKKKISPFLDQQPKIFFDREWGVKRTNALHVVLEYDSTSYSLGEAWSCVGVDFNRFLSNLKKHFGELVHIRSWHGHDSGFPHIDVIIYFNNFEFSAVEWYDKKQDKLSFRIHSKQKTKHHGKYCRHAIKEAWSHGYVDIECVDSMGGAFKDLMKYVTKELDGGAYILTNAMVWYFGKQSFGISQSRDVKDNKGNLLYHKKGFLETIWGTDGGINLVEPSNADAINQLRSNSNRELIAIEVFPIFPAYYFCKPCVTLFNYDKPPPYLCPNIENFFDNFVLNKCDAGVTIRKDGVTVTTYRLREFEIV